MGLLHQAVDGYLKLVRLPIDAATRLLPGNGDGPRAEAAIVAMGAIMPEVLAAADQLESLGVRTGVVCLTSPDLVFRSLQQRGRLSRGAGSDILDLLFQQR